MSTPDDIPTCPLAKKITKQKMNWITLKKSFKLKKTDSHCLLNMLHDAMEKNKLTLELKFIVTKLNSLIIKTN